MREKILKYKDWDKVLFHSITWLGFILIGVFFIWGYYKGIFSSEQAFTIFMNKLGVWGPIVFIFIQGIQVVFPILPGAIGCVGGAVAFGGTLGFLYSYIGICGGSIIAFMIAKKYGLPFMYKIMKPKTIDKGLTWLNKGKKFDVFFALSIFAPIAPDDLLCYIAGLTKMSLKKFTIIILLAKPLTTYLYTAGLLKISELLLELIK